MIDKSVVDYIATGLAGGGALGALLLAAKKFMRSWVSDSAHIETINLLREEVARLSGINTKLIEEVGRLQSQNAKLQGEVEALHIEIRRLQEANDKARKGEGE